MFHSGGNCLSAITTHSAYSSQILSNTRSNSGGALCASDLVEEVLDEKDGLSKKTSHMEGSGPEEEEKEFTSNQGNAHSIHLSCLIEKVFRFQSSDL
ncbi:hypothetical protein VNO77_46895 [Canavalia gladiata]|uniref:Uncharacterized protein n=1 Tax=Canavalia gladiata TaxID=3824 RepID=A0AAN9JFY7_CANGL